MKYSSLAAATIAALTCAAPLRAADPPHPNIVIILADDLGYGDLACYGGLAPTPASDRLASQGLRLTDAYASSATCTPSRYSLLTGQYAWRKKGTGILPGDAALIIEPGRPTLPALLQKAGYTTAAVGKWHLGLGTTQHPADWNHDITPGPIDVGFSHSFIMAATADRVPCVYIDDRRIVGINPGDPLRVNYDSPFPNEPTGLTERDKLKMNWSHGHHDAVVNEIGRIGFFTGGTSALWVDEDISHVFAKQAVQFIEKQKDHPFFLYYATHNIHVPRVPNQQFVGKTTMGPRGDSIVEFDWQVFQVLDTLDRLHLADNTLVILTSDNGPVLDDGYVDDANEKLGNHKPAGPLRGGKYSRFEGGTRIPMIVRWPGHIQPGVTSPAFVSQVDFTASLASLVGQSADPKSSPDSVNVLPALLGQSQQGRPEIIEHAGKLAIRKDNWKFIPPGKVTDHLGPWNDITVPAPGFLYDLSTDPGEQTNLAHSHPDKVKELAKQLEQIRTAGEHQSESETAK
ncbi:MAG TPA: arylsulfatase [Tepidisphaeraceae bacterium]|nr:arylsulfatase [Tepidisphaeraceae bacterium]